MLFTPQKTNYGTLQMEVWFKWIFLELHWWIYSCAQTNSQRLERNLIKQGSLDYIQLKLDLRNLDADGKNDPKMFSQMVVIIMVMNTMVQRRKSH